MRPTVIVALPLLLASSSPSQADTEAVTTTPMTATRIEASPQQENELGAADIARARRWGLGVSEWQRYTSLMTGIRGSVSPATLSPIEVLGIHARSDAERRAYAERWAHLMHEDVERVLAFQRAYDEAYRRLYANEPLIAGGERRSDQAELRSADRLLLFVSPTCSGCDAAVRDTLRLEPQVAGVDVYLVGLNEKAPGEVQAWAASHKLPAALVKSGRVTLNFEAGTLARLGQPFATLPVIMRRRQDDVTVVDLGALR